MRNNLKKIYVYSRMFLQWKKLVRKTLQFSGPKDAPCLVIIPCDPWTVGGSRGDEAMLTGVVHRYRERHPTLPIYIVCAGNEGERYIRGLEGIHANPIVSWNGSYPMKRIYDSIMSVTPTDVVILGADCMDGYYSPLLSLMLLALYDLFSKTKGINARLLGFSFNETPSKLIVQAFKSLNADTIIRLRDSVSLNRYETIVKHQASLVADAAFMLQPESDYPLYAEIERWISQQKEKGQIIIGLNFHPMLRKYSGPEDIKSDAVLLAKNVEKILDIYSSVSFVFIPHDDRSNLTDNLMLSTMYDSLENYHSQIFYSTEVPRAPQLKALCGLLDGLISSRMHLAIAALGMEVPVMAATYQGKFEGLFQHFDYDNSYLLAPQVFLSSEMVSVFGVFIKNLSQLKQQIILKLPTVVQLSNKNLKDE